MHIARVAEFGGSSLRIADTDPFDGLLMDPLEETFDDLASLSGLTQAKRKTDSCGVSDTIPPSLANV